MNDKNRVEGERQRRDTNDAVRSTQDRKQWRNMTEEDDI